MTPGFRPTRPPWLWPLILLSVGVGLVVPAPGIAAPAPGIPAPALGTAARPPTLAMPSLSDRQEPAASNQDPRPAGQPVDAAREAALTAETARIAATLRCPVCRQQSVAESSSRIARDMQGLIRGMLADGKTAEEIEAYFLDAYGDWILLRPKARGVNALVYILPAIAFLIGILWVGVKLRLGHGPPPSERGTETAGAAGLDPQDRAWLDDAIREVR